MRESMIKEFVGENVENGQEIGIQKAERPRKKSDVFRNLDWFFRALGTF